MNRERVLELASQTGMVYLSSWTVDELIKFTALIEAELMQEQEPVGRRMTQAELGIGYDKKAGDIVWWDYPKEGDFIYTHPEPKVPAGWKLVPILSTSSMDASGEEAACIPGFNDLDASDVWNAMLSAAPEYKP